MKPKRYPYSGKKKESTSKTIDVMIDGNDFVEFIRNNRLAQIYGLEKGKINEYLFCNNYCQLRDSNVNFYDCYEISFNYVKKMAFRFFRQARSMVT